MRREMNDDIDSTEVADPVAGRSQSLTIPNIGLMPADVVMIGRAAECLGTAREAEDPAVLLEVLE